jgi:hypothetical protein
MVSERSNMSEHAAMSGLTCETWAPGDGVKRYRFFRGAPAGQTYHGPDDGLYTALGRKDALTWLRGYDAGRAARGG